MIRFAMEQLEKWKAKKRHKPLIICGARQVGMTFLKLRVLALNLNGFVSLGEARSS